MQVYPNRLESTLKQQLLPCYLVFGDEPQQKLEAMSLIRQFALSKGFDERISLIADSSFQWSELVAAGQSMSLFASKQLIELELPTGKPGVEGSKALAEFSDQLHEDLMLVVHGPKIGKDVQKAKWFKSLDNIGAHILCYPLEGNALYAWLRGYCQTMGINLDAQAIQELASYCQGNMLAAKQEVEKLALLYPGASVTVEQLRKVVVDQSRYNVFQLMDAILQGNADQVVYTLLRLESEGIEANIIIWALIKEWQLLWQLRKIADDQQAIQWQKFGIWRNRQSLYQHALQRLTMADLIQIQQQLQHADLIFKQQVVARPYVKLCHLSLLFVGLPLASYGVE